MIIVFPGFTPWANDYRPSRATDRPTHVGCTFTIHLLHPSAPEGRQFLAQGATLGMNDLLYSKPCKGDRFPVTELTYSNASS
jgi:hypothetical protein